MQLPVGVIVQNYFPETTLIIQVEKFLLFCLLSPFLKNNQDNG